jgi:DNA-binding LytR/AlgR family response regulator
MKAIIIEDEDFAAIRLQNMINECDSSIDIVAKLQSVKESVEWLKSNADPDLIFLDIQLEDDLCFSIFDQVNVNSKIIFTTAFDEYAIKAFKLKSIDYLLKPVNREELNKAISKFKNWSIERTILINPDELRSLIVRQKVAYRERFSVTVGEKIKTINVEDIAYFFSTSGITFVVMNTKNQYSIDLSLDSVKEQLNPSDFFRVNRQYLIKLKSIANVHVFPKSRLKLDLNPAPSEEVYVSLEKVPEFKRWLDGDE